MSIATLTAEITYRTDQMTGEKRVGKALSRGIYVENLRRCCKSRPSVSA
jgi:hypothetical protein